MKEKGECKVPVPECLKGKEATNASTPLEEKNCNDG